MLDNLKKMLIVLTCGGALSLSAAAETLNSQASFVMFANDITTWIQDQTNQWLVPNQVVATELDIQVPYHSVIKNISWQGNTTITWTKSATTNVWVFDGQATGVTLNATEFDVNDTFPVSAGGSTFNVSIDANCQNVNFNFPGTWTIHGEIPLSWANNSVQAPLRNFTLTPSTQVPNVTIASCQGPTGMQAFLNQQVAQLYANRALMQTSMAQQIQTFINNQIATVTKMMNQPVTFPILGANVTFTPKTGSNLTNGTWIFDGPVTFQAPQGSDVVTVPAGYVDGNLSDARASGFAFGNSLLSAVLAFYQHAGLIDHTFTSDTVPGFTSFLQNRFEQFFVWEDLWYFDTSTIFSFDLKATEVINVRSQKNMFPGVQWQVSAPVDVVMSAPTRGGSLPYVEFYSNTPAGAKVLAQANNGSLQVTYSVTALDMNYGYRPEFNQVRTPFYGIDVGTIESTVQQSEVNQVWTYTLPDSASPIPNYRLLFQDLIFGTNTFRIEMGIQKK